MSIAGMVRGLGVLGLQLWDTASFIFQPDKPFFEARDADRLAEMEAAVDVMEPTDCGLGGDSFLDPEDGPTPPEEPRYPQKNGANPENRNKLLVSEEPGTAGYGWVSDSDRLDRLGVNLGIAVALLQDIADLLHLQRTQSSAAPATPRRAVEESADGPEDGPLSPPSSGHPHRNFEVLGNDPQSIYERMLRHRDAEDRDPEK